MNPRYRNWMVMPALAFMVTLAACGAANQGAGDDAGAPSGSGGAVGSGGGAVGAGGSGGGSVAGSGGHAPATNDVDNGMLFTDAAVATPDAGAPAADGATKESGSGIPGDGNVAAKEFPALGINLRFTQKGKDVTVVATHKGCTPLTIEIHGGFSCDNTMTQGGIWDGKRGTGIGGTGTFACDAAMVGTLTYTRSGADLTANWTVGDHDAKTDVTYHPMFVDGNCVTFF